ncbi:hypothetical protein BKA69DRAFT_117330 [Paraphysoderma sedebokerense]|nr:hypothetical protein BKA69DRAFT_117330 [Paraphysoderma sedebokerense]
MESLVSSTYFPTQRNRFYLAHTRIMTQLISSTLTALFDSDAPLNSFDFFLQQQLFSLLSDLATDANETAHLHQSTASFISYVCTCEQRNDKLAQLNKRTIEYLSPPASTESAECASYLNKFHGHDLTVLSGLVKLGLKALDDDDFIISWLKDTVIFIAKFCAWYRVASPPMSGIIELWQDRLIQMYESVKSLYRHIVTEERVFRCLLPMVDQLLSATAPVFDVLDQASNILKVASQFESPSVWPISSGLPIISNVLRYQISIQKSQVSEYNWNQFNDSVPDAANTSIQALRSRFQSVLSIVESLLKFSVRSPSGSTSSKFDSYATELSIITAHLFVLHNPTTFWSSQALKEYSTIILTNISELINASVKEMLSFVARDIVTRYVKPFFMQKICMTKGVDFDSFHEEPIWKSDRPECISILEGVIDYVEFPHMSDLVPLVIPPIISLIEYYDVAIKLRGVICLAHVLNESDKSVLRRTGLAAVFLDVCNRRLLVLYICASPPVANSKAYYSSIS